MALLPLVGMASASPPADRLAPLRDRWIARWRATPAELPPLGPREGWRRQWGNARATARLIDELAAKIESYPSSDEERRAWQDAVRARLQVFGETHLGWPARYRRLLLGDAFHGAAIAFLREARALDPRMALDDVGQALRNVWIGNTLQMLLGRTVTLTPSLFAYSMLYPATDNLLDASTVSVGTKHEFNARLSRRLAGDRLAPQSAAEALVSELVDRIDGDCPRHGHPDAWEALLAIHRAQIASLRQQQATVLSEARLLELSFAKGGASVLADLHLLAADVSPGHERFAFGYGVFLQLLDDLQDVAIDLAHGHQTLFTRAARLGALDQVTARLARFIDVVLDEAPVTAQEAADCTDLIRRNCRALLVSMIAEQPRRFSRSFRRTVQRQTPVRLRAIRRLHRRARRRFDEAARHARRRYGAASPIELLLDEATDCRRRTICR